MKYICIFLVLYFIPRPPNHKATTQKLAKDRGKGRSNKNDTRDNVLTNSLTIKYNPANRIVAWLLHLYRHYTNYLRDFYELFTNRNKQTKAQTRNSNTCTTTIVFAEYQKHTTR